VGVVSPGSHVTDLAADVATRTTARLL